MDLSPVTLGYEYYEVFPSATNLYRLNQEW